MKIFIDTANIEEIKEVAKLGIISGVTTNPSLIAKEGRNFEEVIKEITTYINGPISAEVVSLESDKMIEEALALSKIHENITIKLPITFDGLKACSFLSSKNIKTNITLIFSANQALLAARAGATFVSPFIGRIDDAGSNGLEIISEISTIFDVHNIKTKIIAASIRNTNHVKESAILGADIATIPYKVITNMISHPLTDAGINKFISDWESFQGK